jgi:hypothetical protein
MTPFVTTPSYFCRKIETTMNKTHIVKHNCICTRDYILTEGNEYILKEGPRKQVIVVEKIIENSEWLTLLCFFPEESEIKELTHINTDFGYSGMWRIFDLPE